MEGVQEMAIIYGDMETLVHTRSVQNEVTLKTLMEQSRAASHILLRT